MALTQWLCNQRASRPDLPFVLARKNRKVFIDLSCARFGESKPKARRLFVVSVRPPIKD
jgi:hypothetical protein